MKNRLDYRFGERTQTITQKSNGQQTTSYSRPVAGTDQLLGVVTNNGNYRDPTVHSFTHTQIENYQGFLFSESAANVEELRGDAVRTFQHAPSSATSFNELYNDALSQLYAQMKGTLNLAVTAAEAGQVKRMVGNVFKFGNFLRKFTPGKLAGTWLEYQYGWKPLLLDSYSCLDQIMRGRTTQYARIVIRTRAKTSSQRLFLDTWFPGSRELLTEYGSRRVQIIAEFQPKNSALQAINRYTSLNPAVIAWELVPFSFVFDWFLNVGGYLQNLENAFMFDTQLKRAVVTYGFKNEIFGDFDGSMRNGSNFTNCNAHGWRRDTYLSRSPVSVLYPRVPRLELQLGWQRLVSAAALLKVTFGKKNDF